MNYTIRSCYTINSCYTVIENQFKISKKQWHIQKSVFLFDNSQSMFIFDISRTFQSLCKHTKCKHKQYHHQRMPFRQQNTYKHKDIAYRFISTVCVCFGDTMLISDFLESEKICWQSHAPVCHSLIHAACSISLWLQQITHFRSTPLQIVLFIQKPSNGKPCIFSCFATMYKSNTCANLFNMRSFSLSSPMSLLCDGFSCLIQWRLLLVKFYVWLSFG